MCTILFMITFVYASTGIQTNPSTLILNMNKGVEKTINISIINPNDYILYKIKAVGNIVVNPNKELVAVLQPHTNTSISINIITTENI